MDAKSFNEGGWGLYLAQGFGLFRFRERSHGDSGRPIIQIFGIRLQFFGDAFELER
jgi:hypothetical protein